MSRFLILDIFIVGIALPLILAHTYARFEGKVFNLFTMHSTHLHEN
jgi:hypothetical protein